MGRRRPILQLLPRGAFLIPLLLLAVTPLTLQAQYDSVRADFLNYPAPIEHGDFRPSLGMSITVLPQILVEDQVRQTPMLQGRLRYGLPLNISLVGSISTNIITNLIELEGNWSLELDRFAFAASYRLGWWYGFAPIEGFDVDAQSWINFPGVSAGVRIRDFYISARAEAQILSSLEVRTDGIETNSNTNSVAGYSFAMFLEQPFWGETDVALGLRINYSRLLY